MSSLIDDLSQLVNQVHILQNKVTKLEGQIDQLKKEQKNSEVPEIGKSSGLNKCLMLLVNQHFF